MILFRRRDTRLWVLGLGGVAAVLPLTFALGTPACSLAVQVPLSMVAFAVAAAAILRWRRKLPPDLDLEWVAPAEAVRLLAAPPPPDATMVFVSFKHDWLCRARLDLLVEGQRVGQLPAGTAMLVSLSPGLQTVQAFLDRPRTTVSELVNAIPGGTANYCVRNRGSRAIELEFRRVPDSEPPVLGRHMRLVRVRPS